MNSQRPYRPRHHDLIRDHLEVWASVVEHAERHDDVGDLWDSFCPTCGQSWDSKFDARERLEAVIRKGGRRSREVAARVAPLDDRFERATAYLGSSHRGDHWWDHGRLGRRYDQS